MQWQNCRRAALESTAILVKHVASFLELLGIAVLVTGCLYAMFLFLRNFLSQENDPNAYQTFRTGLGRAIMLGLEFLVGADIINSVAVDPTYEGVGVLGMVVLIRTFLSFTFQVEIDGRLPWQKKV